MYTGSKHTMDNKEHKDIELFSVDVVASNQSTINEKETNSKMNLCRLLCESSLLVRRALTPLAISLKIFGLNFGANCPLARRIDKFHRAGFIYSTIVMVVLTLNVIRYIFAFIYQKDFSVYQHLEYFLWFVKCTVQAGFCLILCHRSSEDVLSKIQQLIADYDKTLMWFAIPDEKTRKHFLIKSKVILGVMFTIICVNNIAIYIGMFGSYKDLNDLALPFLHPFPTNAFTKLFYCVVHTYNSFAWVFPVILYCLLCNSLCLIFNQFYVGIEKMDEQLTVKKNIREIRRQYVHMSQLCGKTDDVIGFLALCVYLLDIILSCFNLYHLIYIAKDMPQRAMAGFWVVITVGNLFVMSLSASCLADKVRKNSVYSVKITHVMKSHPSDHSYSPKRSPLLWVPKGASCRYVKFFSKSSSVNNK